MWNIRRFNVDELEVAQVGTRFHRLCDLPEFIRSFGTYQVQAGGRKIWFDDHGAYLRLPWGDCPCVLCGAVSVLEEKRVNREEE